MTAQTGRKKPRVKAWQPKVKTGCRTCKQRKIKCDEGKPACQRCLKAKLVCDGYDTVPHTWIFEHPEASSSFGASETLPQRARPDPGQAILRYEPQARDDSHTGSSTYCLEYQQSDCVCQEDELTKTSLAIKLAERLSRLSIRPSGRYKTTEEQYFFKYFLENGAISVARSDISSAFWMDFFPKAAYKHDSIKNALLYSSTMMQALYKHVWLQSPVRNFEPRAIDFENRAIDALTREAPSVETMLIASNGFWFGAVAAANWAKALQHNYFALKIIAGIEDRSKYDPLVIRYTEILSTSGLAYYRATIGPCKLHKGASLTDCEASCFIPPPFTIEMRVADAAFHLREAVRRLSRSAVLLDSLPEPHLQHARIVSLMKRQEREVLFLLDRWSDPYHLEILPDVFAKATEDAPHTFSPFAPIHARLEDFITNPFSKVSFGELELQMRVLLPNFMTATSQGHPILLMDTCTTLFATTYLEGRKKLENEPGRKKAEMLLSEFTATSPP